MDGGARQIGAGRTVQRDQMLLGLHVDGDWPSECGWVLLMAIVSVWVTQIECTYAHITHAHASTLILWLAQMHPPQNDANKGRYDAAAICNMCDDD